MNETLQKRRPAPRARGCRGGRAAAGTRSQAASRQIVLTVDFESADGRRWSAIGGGNTTAEAHAFARASLPDGIPWRRVASRDLYGD